jgi:hypothetical protein
MNGLTTFTLAVLLLAPLGALHAAEPVSRVYQVGPTRSHHTLQEISGSLAPGDRVEVDGGNRFPGGIAFNRYGTADRPITIRGVKVNGQRPQIAGGRDVVDFTGSNYVFEGFEIAEAERRGLNHRADNITIRDCIVRDCPNGIMSSDHASGNLTVEYCEVLHCGRGQVEHQFYIATDEDMHPGSVFRLRFCYIHDGTGGNNVKSRAERTLVYGNWISSAFYHNLELIGADPAGGVRADRAREDGDVVGNVLIASRFGRNVRVGGDGTGQSNGRYRFLNNTFIHRAPKPESHLHARFGVESVEMHNNVFFLLSGAVFDDARAEWVSGVRRVSGTANWVHRSARSLPAEWTRTITSMDPGLAGLENNQLRPVQGSPLIGAGVSDPASPPGAPFPDPTLSAAHHPPEARLLPIGGAEFRDDRPPDIGAFAGSFRPGGTGRETFSKNAPQTAPYGTGQTR